MKHNDKNILLVEDDVNFGAILNDFLKLHSYNVTLAKNGIEGLEKFKKNDFGLCILDVMLPFKDGFTLAKEIREINKDVPLFFLTAKTLKDDVLKGYKIGADDYLTKPFSYNELLARIKAILRRSNPNTVSDNLEFEDLVLDRIEKRVYRDKKEIQLGPTEFRLLEFFLVNPKRVYSRDQILENVWPNNINVESRTIDVHIRRLRKSINIQNKKEFIRTVRSSGYSLI